eukprot:229225_1
MMETMGTGDNRFDVAEMAAASLQPTYSQPPSNIVFRKGGSEVFFLGTCPNQKQELQLFDLRADPPEENQVVTFLDDDSVIEHKYTKEEELLRERMRQSGHGVTSYTYNEMYEKLLIPTSGGMLWYCALPKGPIEEPIPATLFGDREMDNLGPRMDSKFSPDTRLVAFTRKGDLWCAEINEMDGTTFERRLTFVRDQDPKLSAGEADFIMQEEFDRYTGYYWCPEVDIASTDVGETRTYRILYEVVDSSKVPTVRLPNPDISASVDEMLFPRVGEPNATSRLRILELTVSADLRSATSQEVDLARSLRDRFSWCEYVPRFGWAGRKDRFWAQCLDRNQQKLVMIVLDITKDCKPVGTKANDISTSENIIMLTEESDFWLNTHGICEFLEDGSGLIWASERTGFQHLYLIPLRETSPSADPIALTSGDWHVSGGSISVDFKNRRVYFESTRDTPLQNHLYVVSLDSPCDIQRVTAEGMSHSISFNSDFSKFADTYSNVRTPGVTSIFELNWHDGLVISKPTIKLSEQRPAEDIKFEVTPSIVNFQIDGTTLHGMVYKPPTFTPGESSPLPTIIFGYGGPHVQLVWDKFPSRDGKLRLLASLGYCVAMVDPRGHYRRGIAFEGHLKWRMGQVESDQQSAFVNYLVKEGFADANRVAISGWSYGGYLSLLCLAQKPDVFKIAISAAPVTKLEYYDTAWTERYMGLPADNPEGYSKSSILNIADQFPDEENRLVLIHGFMDENVHLVHSTALIDKLIELNKPFDFKLFPSERHGIRSIKSNVHFLTFMIRFFQKHL